ncbi:MAG: type II toxin-antitoxin system HipA family toxin, partial [Propionibacteriaceae bacterium]|nr:type II toxin-antitoxin system HipA family toxin [Propionibacteriaceae bacterium]
MSQLLTYVEIDGTTILAGRAYVSLRRGRLTSTFSYDDAYLALPSAYELDPELPLTVGQLAVSSPLPRAFLDAAPDRWGRNLIRRQALLEGKQSLDERDYLLGVGDLGRQGALRFKLDESGPFRSPLPDIPKLIDLPRLLDAATLVAQDAAAHPDAVKLLLDVGSATLGGARPKALVRDADRLYLAKFPQPQDRYDVVVAEHNCLALAAECGIDVAPHRLVSVSGAQVLLEERFDRHHGQRVGYLSALTLLRANDGDRYDYLDIAEEMARVSVQPSADLEQLFRRAAFSYLVNNTDDHLRNHGMLRAKHGWRLAPAFDLNPDPDT